MTQYVGCLHARTLLEGLLDGELSMADQLAVESHLRWCDTCALRVADMRLIGSSLRDQSPAQPLGDDEDATLTALTDGVLMRVRAERAQSIRSRVLEMFADRRLLWPALGAASAVFLCVAASFSVLHASSSRLPGSLAGMISVIGSPGTEKRPLRPADNGVSIPRLSDDEAERAGGTLEMMPDEDMIYAVRGVVGRDGTLSNFELLLSDDTSPADRVAVARAAAQEVALMNAARNTRFLPAQTPMGQAVAVDIVWVIAKTTAIVGPPDVARNRAERIKDGVKPSPRGPSAPPVSEQPATPRRSGSATA